MISQQRSLKQGRHNKAKAIHADTSQHGRQKTCWTRLVSRKIREKLRSSSLAKYVMYAALELWLEWLSAMKVRKKGNKKQGLEGKSWGYQRLATLAHFLDSPDKYALLFLWGGARNVHLGHFYKCFAPKRKVFQKSHFLWFISTKTIICIII